MTYQIMYSYSEGVLRVLSLEGIVLEEALTVDEANARVKELYNIDPQIQALTTPD